MNKPNIDVDKIKNVGAFAAKGATVISKYGYKTLKNFNGHIARDSHRKAMIGKAAAIALATAKLSSIALLGAVPVLGIAGGVLAADTLATYLLNGKDIGKTFESIKNHRTALNIATAPIIDVLSYIPRGLEVGIDTIAQSLPDPDR